ncbi:hypothetical protein FRB93_007514 [Tulasnella sp. JGI-2019a]|nr:hypothetical protein FRB93_007514 [Tulasnella sp. JGI-2019a]
MPIASDDELEIFLSKMAPACPSLQNVALHLVSLQAAGTSSLSSRSLTPLFQCSQIGTLEVKHNRPIVVNDQHIASMASAGPSLIELLLSPNPTNITDDTPATSILALKAFARYFRQHRLSLGLYFAIPNDLAGSPISPMLDLKVLDVGGSEISVQAQMAVMAFLGCICSSRVQIRDSRPTWFVDSGSMQALDDVAEATRIQRWEGVEQGIRGLHQLQSSTRQELRTRVGELERQLEEKDKRIRALEQSSGVGSL